MRLRLALPAGAIRIEEGEPGAVELALTVMRGDRSAVDDVAIEARELPGGGHEVRVEHNVKGFFLKLGRSLELALDLRVPPGSDVECSTASAHVITHGLLGAVNVKTASGDLSFDRVGSFRAHTASGDVFVAEVRSSVAPV